MAVYASWLADCARMTGYPVVETTGWRGRGHGGFRVIEGCVDHHTADGAGEYPSMRVVTHGRAGLAGPLANYGLGRSGTIYVIAAGVGWHAGASTWAGYRDLNDEFIGIEAESRGTVDDWSAEQRDCYPRLCAAIMHFIRRGADRVAAHREVCLPRGRKIDPAFWDMGQMRAHIGWMLADPGRRIPRGGGGAAPALPFQEEDGMNCGSWIPGTDMLRCLSCPVGPDYLHPQGWFSLTTGWGNGKAHIWFIKASADRKPIYTASFDTGLRQDVRESWEIPPGTEQISVQYTSAGPVGWSLELVDRPPVAVKAATAAPAAKA